MLVSKNMIASSGQIVSSWTQIEIE